MSSAEHPRLSRHLLDIGLQLAIIVLIIGGGLIGWHTLLASKPRMQRSPAPKTARLVQTMVATRETVPVLIQAMGTVQAARSLKLTSELAGRVSWLSPAFTTGATVTAGEELLRIDEADYRFARQGREAELLIHQANLTRELGQRAIAESELALLDEELTAPDRALVLRQPQLQAAQAQVAAAEAALDQATLDLARCRVVAPFAAVISTTEVDIGARVNPGSPLAHLIGDDECWIECLVTQRDLTWLRPALTAGRPLPATISNPGAWGVHTTRSGHLLRLLPALETAGRMARVLISVADPFADDQAPLLLGSFVQVEIQASELVDHVVIPRAHLHAEDTVRVLDAEGRLAIHPVTVIWRDRERAVIASGLEAGARIVTSPLNAAVVGMALRSEDAASTEDPADPETTKATSTAEAGS